MERNAAFEAALDVAFESAKEGKRSSLAFDEGPYELVLRDGSRREIILLKKGDTTVYFHHSDNANFGQGKSGEARTRHRKHYIIGFDRNSGSIMVDGRSNAVRPKIKYCPSNAYGVRGRSSHLQLPRVSI